MSNWELNFATSTLLAPFGASFSTKYHLFNCNLPPIYTNYQFQKGRCVFLENATGVEYHNTCNIYRIYKLNSRNYKYWRWLSSFWLLVSWITRESIEYTSEQKCRRKNWYVFVPILPSKLLKRRLIFHWYWVFFFTSAPVIVKWQPKNYRFGTTFA